MFHFRLQGLFETLFAQTNIQRIWLQMHAEIHEILVAAGQNLNSQTTSSEILHTELKAIKSAVQAATHTHELANTAYKPEIT